MKRSSVQKSMATAQVDSENLNDIRGSKAMENRATLSKLDSDLAVERGSQALARHASRRQFVSLCRWLTVAAITLGTIGLGSYLVYPRISQLPWQNYFDRFDFRLQPEEEQDVEKAGVAAATSKDDS